VKGEPSRVPRNARQPVQLRSKVLEVLADKPHGCPWSAAIAFRGLLLLGTGSALLASHRQALLLRSRGGTRCLSGSANRGTCALAETGAKRLPNCNFACSSPSALTPCPSPADHFVVPGERGVVVGPRRRSTA